MKNLLRTATAAITAILAHNLSAQCIELSTEADGVALCSYETATLEATPGFDNYRFYYNFSDSNQDGTLFTETSEHILELPAGEWAVTYWYVETDDPSCTETSGTVWWDAWVFQNPVVMHDANTMLCPGDSSLVEMPFPGPAFFQWSKDFTEIPGAVEPQYWVNEPGMYTVAVAYADCPEQWLSSGIGPTFQFYNVTPLTIEVDESGDFPVLTASHGTELQWFFNGAPIEGATGAEYTATENGFYSAEGFDSNGCSLASEPVEVILLSIDEALSASVNLYPNPFKDQLQVSVGDARVLQVRIFDLTGKPVLSEVRNVSGTFTLAIPGAASGVYFVEITAENGARYTSKILKK